MNQILTPKKAAAAGMEPLTLPMKATDPELRQVYNDMTRIPGTTWALVRSRMNTFEVWRRPITPRIHADGRLAKRKTP